MGKELEVGDPADFVHLASGSLPEAVVDRPSRPWWYGPGRPVARDGRLV
ncbi:hypothetical protein [Streptomyces sp. NPDC051286]